MGMGKKTKSGGNTQEPLQKDKILCDLKTAVTKIRKLVDEADSTRKAGVKYVQFQEQKLKQAIEDLTTAFNVFEENEPQLRATTRILDELREIKESLKTQSVGQQKTWSQIAAEAPPSHSVAEHRALERAKERNEREILVTIRDQKEREEMTGKDRQELIQKVKEHCPNEARDAIATIRKTPMGYAIKAKSSEGKQAITNNTDWIRKVTPSAIYREQTFPIVVHSVLLEDTLISDQKHTITRMLEDNKSRIPNLEITQIRSLTSTKRANQTYGSVVLETTRSEAANAVISRGLSLDGEIKICERYVPESRIRHCTQCQSYGHRATACKQPQRCAKCGGLHAEDCGATPPTKCKICNGVHPDIANICRNRREEVARARKAIEHTPYLFKEVTTNTQPRPGQYHSQQTENEWTKVEKARRGRPTDLERAGADPRQTRLQKTGEKRIRDSPTPPPRMNPNSPQKIANRSNDTLQDIDTEDYMSDV